MCVPQASKLAAVTNSQQLPSQETVTVVSATVEYLEIALAALFRVLPFTAVQALRRGLQQRSHVHVMRAAAPVPKAPRISGERLDLSLSVSLSLSSSPAAQRGDLFVSSLPAAQRRVIHKKGSVQSAVAGDASSALRSKEKETQPSLEEVRSLYAKESARLTALRAHLRLMDAYEEQEQTLEHQRRRDEVTNDFHNLYAALQQEEDITRPRLAQAKIDLRSFCVRYADSNKVLTLTTIEQVWRRKHKNSAREGASERKSASVMKVSERKGCMMTIVMFILAPFTAT